MYICTSLIKLFILYKVTYYITSQNIRKMMYCPQVSPSPRPPRNAQIKRLFYSDLYAGPFGQIIMFLLLDALPL